MGDLEFHYQKVEEAKQQGIEEGKQIAAEESSGDGSGIFLLLLAIIFGIFLIYNHGSVITTSTGTETKAINSQESLLPSDIGDYIANDNTKFYKYTGSDGVTYVRHHYEPNDQISKQGYYKSDTGEYILLTMSFYPQNENWVCNWRIDYSVNGHKQTLSNGADTVYEVGISSENCVNSLVQALADYGYDSTVSTSEGTAVTPSEGRSIIGY